MKKTLLVCIMFLISIIVSTWAVADPLVSDLDPFLITDVNAAYWTGSDYNAYPSLVPQPHGPDQWVGNSQLKNANEDTEEAWLEALLGKAYNDPSVGNPQRILAGSGGLGPDDKILTGLDPGFAWDYAVVKYDGYWIAFQNDGINGLTTDELHYGISHITFFGPAAIPEPATMLLLGSGLIGLAGFARRRFRRN